MEKKRRKRAEVAEEGVSGSGHVKEVMDGGSRDEELNKLGELGRKVYCLKRIMIYLAFVIVKEETRFLEGRVKLYSFISLIAH